MRMRQYPNGFLQTIELLNLLMKIYVYRWNTQIGAKIPFFLVMLFVLLGAFDKLKASLSL